MGNGKKLILPEKTIVFQPSNYQTSINICQTALGQNSTIAADNCGSAISCQRPVTIKQRSQV